MQLETAGGPQQSSAVYRVSYDEERVGRMVKKSKTRVTWTFVCASQEQHWVVLSWSKATGKQEITMDGQSVWFSRNKGRSVLDHHWKSGSIELHALATSAPKLSADFRNYDLVINGRLFASLPRHNNIGRSDEDAEMAWRAQNQNNNNNPSSIIEILYPQGYVSPVDKSPQLLDPGQRQKRQESSAGQYAIALAQSAPPSNSNNGVSHPPMVDLLS